MSGTIAPLKSLEVDEVASKAMGILEENYRGWACNKEHIGKPAVVERVLGRRLTPWVRDMEQNNQGKECFETYYFVDSGPKRGRSRRAQRRRVYLSRDDIHCCSII